MISAVNWAPPRGPIDPFISGDTFRAHCDYVYDELDMSFNPEGVLPGTTVFINGDLLGEYIENDPRIRGSDLPIF